MPFTKTVPRKSVTFPTPPTTSPEVAGELATLKSLIISGFSALTSRLEAVTEGLARRTKSHLTVDEVADLTGRAPYTIRRWVKEGRIQAQRLREGGPKGRLLIAREEVQKLIETGFGAEVPSEVSA